jgi:hypothetical protein
LGLIVDCWVYGVANCPYDRILGNLNSAEVTRDGKDRGEVFDGDVRSTALRLVGQDPGFINTYKNVPYCVGRVCDIALLGHRHSSNEMEEQTGTFATFVTHIFHGIIQRTPHWIVGSLAKHSLVQESNSVIDDVRV